MTDAQYNEFFGRTRSGIKQARKDWEKLSDERREKYENDPDNYVLTAMAESITNLFKIKFDGRKIDSQNKPALLVDLVNTFDKEKWNEDDKLRETFGNDYDNVLAVGITEFFDSPRFKLKAKF